MSIIVAVGIIIIIGFANRSSEQGRKIESLERDKKGLSEHVNALVKDSARFEKELSETKDELNYHKRSADQLKVDINELEDALATANENIEAYKQTIDQLNLQLREKEQTIDQLNLQLREKEQTISNLRSQIQNQTSSNVSPQITISKIELAGHKNNKSIVFKFGEQSSTFGLCYFKVRMNYSCTSSGVKDLTLYSTETEQVYLYPKGTYEFNTYLGNKGKRLNAGIYRVVISYKGDVIKSEDFIIH